MHKGIDFIRVLQARAANPKDPEAAADWIAKRWGPNSNAYAVQKAGVGAIGTADLTNVGYQARQEFFALAREASILGRLPFSRSVPFHVPLISMAGGTTGYWVGQQKPIPVSKPAVLGSSLGVRKVAGIVVVAKAALRSTDPRTETILRNDLVRACALMLDTALLDPSNAGDDATPASPLNGVTPISGTGDPKADMSAALEGFGGDLATSVLLTDPVAGMQLALSGPGFPDAGPRGGMAAGMQLLTSSASPRASAGGQMALLDAAGFAVALEDVDIAVSDQATLEMSDAPTGEGDGPQAQSQEMASLYQNELQALKIVIRCNWEKQRANSVTYIDGFFVQS